MKHLPRGILRIARPGAPSRVRGLKPTHRRSPTLWWPCRTLAGAWIETHTHRLTLGVRGSRTLAGAWIETPTRTSRSAPASVAPSRVRESKTDHRIAEEITSSWLRCLKQLDANAIHISFKSHNHMYEVTAGYLSTIRPLFHCISNLCALRTTQPVARKARSYRVSGTLARARLRPASSPAGLCWRGPACQRAWVPAFAGTTC